MLNEAAPEGKELKYARPELERRFLFSALPLGRAIRVARIEDRYLLGTRIRLRKATERADVDGEVNRIVYKLTQKVPGPGCSRTHCTVWCSARPSSPMTSR